MNYFYCITFVPFNQPEEDRLSIHALYEDFLTKIQPPDPRVKAIAGDFVVTNFDFDTIEIRLQEIFGNNGCYCLIDRNDTARVGCQPKHLEEQIKSIPKVDINTALLQIEDLFQAV